MDVVTLGMAKADARKNFAPLESRPAPAALGLSRLPAFTVYKTGPRKFATPLDVQALRPPAGVTYYVSPGGSAGADGLTPATATTVPNALSKADIGTLVYAPGEYFRNRHSLAGTATTKSINYLAAGPGVKVTGWEDPAGLTWTLTSGSVYQTTRAATQLVTDTRAANRTTWGDYPIYTKKADLASVTGPGQWAIVGSTVYVWALGGSNLVTDSSFMRLSVTSTNGVQVNGDNIAYVEGIDFEGCGGSANGPVAAFTAGSTAANAPRIIAVDCSTRYTPYSGFTAYGAAWAIFVRCLASSIGLDGFNYHKDTLNGADSRPEYLEVDCVARYTGLTTATENGNGTSAHDQIKGVRINGDYSKSYGPVVVDVDGTKSWILGCTASASTATGNPWAFGASGPGAAPMMWLDECTASDTGYGVYAASAATVAVNGLTVERCTNPHTRADTATIVRYNPKAP